LSVIDKPHTAASVPGALLNIDVPPVAVRTVASKLALPEPIVKMPGLTIGGKVKPPAKQIEMERYRLPQTTESITRERIDNTINMANPEDAIKYMPSIQVAQPLYRRYQRTGRGAHLGHIRQCAQPALSRWHSAVFLAWQQQYQRRLRARPGASGEAASRNREPV